MPSTERKIRASLPITRFMQTYIPLPVAHWLLKRGMARVQLDADVIREAVTADGVPCEWIIPLTLPQAIQSLDGIAHFLKAHLEFDT